MVIQKNPPSIRRNGIRRVASFLLALVMSASLFPLEAFAAPSGKSGSGTYLEGWTVEVLWETFSSTYNWEASSDSTDSPRLEVVYRNLNLTKDLHKGDLTFEIPGIGEVNRSNILQADKIAAGKGEDWSVSWDSKTDKYTFTNNFELKQGDSLNGGFEFQWKLDARSGRRTSPST